MPRKSPPSLVALRDLSYATPDGRILFEDVTLAFGRKRTGLVGRNGVGKSTILKLIAGELAPRSGTILREGRIGVLRQRIAAEPDETVGHALGASEGLARLERLGAGRGTLADAADADWTLPARIDEALAAVGLPDVEPFRPLASLSGGQRTRAALAALLLNQPDMILLDEPTNNLDAAGREAVRDVLQNWRGGAIVVSHDRALLREMDEIVELSTRGAGVYGGNYDLYAEQKATERAAAERNLADAEQRVEDVARRTQAARERQERRQAAGRRSRAKGDIPKIMLNAMRQRSEQTSARGSKLAERQSEQAATALEEARGAVERLQRLSVALPESSLASRKTVLAFDEVSFAYPGERPIINGLTFAITGPERVALTGPNGSGKTTVLKLATGALSPTRGQVRRSNGVALLDQECAFLDRRLSILDNFRAIHPASNLNAAHAALARFLFRNEAAHQIVGSLSGGETLRAGLAIVLGGGDPPKLIVLDEPTNHLDLDSIHAIEDALAKFDGAILAVSHDEDFLEAIGVTRRLRLPLSRH